MHRICKIVVCFMVVLPAQAQSLSLQEAQRRAVARSQQQVGQDSAIAAAREMAVAAGQLPDPVLKLGVDNLPVSGDDRFSLTRDSMTMRRIGVMQEFTRSEKRELRAQRFGREAEKATLEKAASAAMIQRDTALAWLDRYYAEAMGRVIAEQMAQVKREIAAAEAGYRVGRGSQADVIAAHGTLAALEDRASEFRRKAGSATAILARWIGEGADAPLAPVPSIDTVRIDAQNIESDLVHHPEIAVLARQQEIAATEAKIAQASRTPDWSVEIAYQQRGPDYSNMVSLGVSIPLPWDRGNRQDREVAAKLAVAEQARGQREEMLRAHSRRSACPARRVAERPRAPGAVRARPDPARRRAQPRRPGSLLQGGRASLTDVRSRAATRPTCACRRCSSRWRPRACGRSSTLTPHAGAAP
jgi:outer membrane protein TolC